MAITPVEIPQIPQNSANLVNTDFDRAGDKTLRYMEFPVEEYRFTGDGATTTKTVQTGLTRVMGAMVFNMTDGTYWANSILAKINPTNPTQVDVSSIPADTDVYLLRVWGDKIVRPVGSIDSIDPTVPDNLTAEPDSDTQITLSWDASSHFGSGVDGYEYRVDSGAAVDVGNILTAAKTGLTPDTDYDFEVRAYATDPFGNKRYSGWSAVVQASTLV